MTRVLVSGGLGFIGCHLSARLLTEGFAVDALDNGQRGAIDATVEGLARRGPYRVLRRNLNDGAALEDLPEDYELVFHLAAIVGVGNVVARPYRVLRDNADALARMLDWSLRLKRLRRFIFPSTSEVYAGTLECFGMRIPTPEDTPLAIPDPGRPRTSYMLSKLYGEALCRHAAVPFTIVRPHNIYGPRMGMAHVVPELLKRAHDAEDGQAITVFSPGHKRTFCYIDDAVELLLRLAHSPRAEGGTFNVGSPDEETTMADLAAIVARTVGRRIEIAPGPDTEGSPARRRPDMSRTLAATSLRAFVPLEEGVRRTYEWYRTNLFETESVRGASAP